MFRIQNIRRSKKLYILKICSQRSFHPHIILQIEFREMSHGAKKFTLIHLTVHRQKKEGESAVSCLRPVLLVSIPTFSAQRFHVFMDQRKV